MDYQHVSQDDLLDVMEMTKKLEHTMLNMLKNNQLTIGMSALMSASVNCTIAQCKTMEEVLFYKFMFMAIFDEAVKSIQIK